MHIYGIWKNWCRLSYLQSGNIYSDVENKGTNAQTPRRERMDWEAGAGTHAPLTLWVAHEQGRRSSGGCTQCPVTQQKCQSHGRVWHSAALWTIAHQAPLSMGFSMQAYQSGLPFPSPGTFPTQDLTRVSCTAGRVFTGRYTREPVMAWKGRRLKRGEAYTCSWFTLLYGKDQHNTLKQLYRNNIFFNVSRRTRHFYSPQCSPPSHVRQSHHIPPTTQQLLTPGSGSHPQGFVCPDSPPGPADTPCTVSWPGRRLPSHQPDLCSLICTERQGLVSMLNQRVGSPCHPSNTLPWLTVQMKPTFCPRLPRLCMALPWAFLLLICLSFQTKATKRGSCSEP